MSSVAVSRGRESAPPQRGVRILPYVPLPCADALAVFLSAAAAVLARYALGGDFTLGFYLTMVPALAILPAAFALSGLYSVVALHPAIELQRIVRATTVSYILLAASTFFARDAEAYSRAILLASWALTLVAVPVGRLAARHAFGKRDWWGEAAIVLGGGPAAQAVSRILRERPSIGLRPVGLLDDLAPDRPDPAAAPYLGPLSRAPQLAAGGLRYAIIAMPGLPSARLADAVETYASRFPNVLIIPDLFGISSLGVETRDFGGVLGVAVRHRLLDRVPRLAKRAFDVALSAALLAILAPFLAIIAISIWTMSPGPVLYSHRRLGLGGREFAAWKFRSMVQDGERVLDRYLRDHPEMRAEWDRDRKLRRDPRITGIGRFLRKTSLDELPQLWNVLRGEMSLVGPRPIVKAEVERYGPKYSLYCKVRPGITGLWQVSGRNKTTYARRVELDEFYVRNWSIWLDIYILTRTAGVVLTGDGAY